MGSLIPLFWTSGHICPEFQSQGGSLARFPSLVGFPPVSMMGRGRMTGFERVISCSASRRAEYYLKYTDDCVPVLKVGNCCTKGSLWLEVSSVKCCRLAIQCGCASSPGTMSVAMLPDVTMAGSQLRSAGGGGGGGIIRLLFMLFCCSLSDIQSTSVKPVHKTRLQTLKYWGLLFKGYRRINVVGCVRPSVHRKRGGGGEPVYV